MNGAHIPSSVTLLLECSLHQCFFFFCHHYLQYTFQVCIIEHSAQGHHNSSKLWKTEIRLSITGTFHVCFITDVPLLPSHALISFVKNWKKVWKKRFCPKLCFYTIFLQIFKDNMPDLKRSLVFFGIFKDTARKRAVPNVAKSMEGSKLSFYGPPFFCAGSLRN